jgi:hypothetical protein
MSWSARSFVRSPPKMQPSCPALSLVTRVGFTLITLRQSNNLTNGKVQDHWEQSQEHSHNFLRHKGDCSQRIGSSRPNSQLCVPLDILRLLRESMRRLIPELWREKNWLLHHDNAPSHASFSIRELLAKRNMTFVPNPPYSPDLAPCYFSVFRILTQLRWMRESPAVLKTLTEQEFQDEFKSWQKLWERCIHTQGH